MDEYKVPTLTVGELIERLSKYPPETYVLSYVNENMCDYQNVAGVNDEQWVEESSSAIVIELSDTYDSRQW